MADLNDLVDIFLQPGEMFVTDGDYRIRTMLGSCVSITLWHAATRTGGMSHFLLPTRGTGAAGPVPDGRYGDEALEYMLGEFARVGAAPSQCQGKVFGGGNMFPEHARPGFVNIGERNGHAALALLRHHGIPVVSEHLFGVGHRQIILNVTNGDVWSRQIAPTSADDYREEAMP